MYMCSSRWSAWTSEQPALQMDVCAHVPSAMALMWAAGGRVLRNAQDVGVLRRAFTQTQLRELAALCEALHGDEPPTHHLEEPLHIDWLA